MYFSAYFHLPKEIKLRKGCEGWLLHHCSDTMCCSALCLKKYVPVSCSMFHVYNKGGRLLNL